MVKCKHCFGKGVHRNPEFDELVNYYLADRDDVDDPEELIRSVYPEVPENIKCEVCEGKGKVAKND